MDCIMEELNEYQDYLNELAQSQSDVIFNNGDKWHASILMATMFRNTKSYIRMYSTGLRPQLIEMEPYFSVFRTFFEDQENKVSIDILVETEDSIKNQPFIIVRGAMANKQNIRVRQIRPQDKSSLNKTLGFERCNLSVFDETKFRLEYDPDGFKAIASFNQPEWAGKLSDLFDNAFNNGFQINGF